MAETQSIPPTATTTSPRSRRRWVLAYVVVILFVAIATVGATMLLQNIATRKHEGESYFVKLVDIDEKTDDPALWGKNFPRHYDAYKRTVDMERTRFGGSEADPADAGKTYSKIDADPRLKTMWDGYAFAIDFREERGHAYMLQDQRDTDRVKKKPQPGACLHCHASVPVAYRQQGLSIGAPGSATDALTSDAGMKQLMEGFKAVCKMTYADATQLVRHPVACIDCHDPQTMQSRVTRPGFINGIQRLAESNDPVPHLPSIERWRKTGKSTPYDPNKDASRQEMRSFVCGQCHVEYYFRGTGKLLTYPWHNGLKMEQIESYYDDPMQFDAAEIAEADRKQPYKDWKHAKTDAPCLKAQHPEFELWSQGIHARSGVACADCHMPYMREGAVKISDHHVRSPLLNINRSCQTCHRFPEEELKARAVAIQECTQKTMNLAQEALDQLIKELARAKNGGTRVEPSQLEAARNLQRRAQWRIDFINAENSTGFHAPQEASRILAEAIDFARQGQLKLAPKP